jgi:23S rRNA (guanosine2251-2'-O)-methyltransferase
MILYGRNAVREALRGRRASAVTEVWATHGVVREPWPRDVQVRTSTAAEIERRCGSSAHQGVCAWAGGYPYVSAAELLVGPEPLVVALDEVQDPQNLGSICRTAECAGATGVVIPERRAADVTPATCKASAGAVEHLRIARVRNLADFLIQAREAGCWCYGAAAPAVPASASSASSAASVPAPAEPVPAESASGERAPVGSPVPYDTPDYRGAGVVLVLGSEGRGLRPRVASSCDELIALPLHGRVQSLGVSAAAAAILYEILQNRRRAS